MKLWISRLFLTTGLILLLFHNVVAHHHDEGHDGYIQHHDHDGLEHVKIEHAFYTDYTFINWLPAIVPDLVSKPEYNFVLFPFILHIKPLILPNEPCPPGWLMDQIILRGPPSHC